jgi:hypothetical protein
MYDFIREQQWILEKCTNLPRLMYKGYQKFCTNPGERTCHYRRGLQNGT